MPVFTDEELKEISNAPSKNAIFSSEEITEIKQTPSFPKKPGLLGNTLKEYGAQLSDLFKIPSMLAGTPRPPLTSKLATETIPQTASNLWEKFITPITFKKDVRLPSNIGEYAKMAVGKKPTSFKTTDIGISPFDVVWYGTIGKSLANNQIAAYKWNRQMDNSAKTAAVKSAVMNNIPIFEKKFAETGIELPKNMPLEAKTDYILAQRRNPAIRRTITDLARRELSGKPIVTADVVDLESQVKPPIVPAEKRIETKLPITTEESIKKPVITKPIVSSQIPVLKNTRDAIIYGETIKGDKEAVKILIDEREKLLKQADEILALGDNMTIEQEQKGMNIGVKAQFLREAIESSEGKIKPIDLERIEELVTGAKQTEIKKTEVKVIPKKESLKILPNKKQLILQIQEAYKKAPDIQLPPVPLEKENLPVYYKAVEDMGIKKIAFQINGGAEIWNTKNTLAEFGNKIINTPEDIKDKTAMAKRTIGVNVKSEEIDDLLPIEKKGYFTDGKVLVKGIPSAKSKIKEGTQIIKSNVIDNFLSLPTKPAKKLYYYIDAPDVKGVSPNPIGYKEKTHNPFIVFESSGKYYKYDQYRFNVISKRFPDADYGISDNGRLIAYKDKEPVGLLLPTGNRDNPAMTEPPYKISENVIKEPVAEVVNESSIGDDDDIIRVNKSGLDLSLKGDKIESFEKVKGEYPNGIKEFKLFDETLTMIHKFTKRIGGVGERYVPRKAYGVFYADTGNIMVAALNNISVAIHEITHSLDNKVKLFKKIMGEVGRSKNGNPIYSPATQKIRNELTKIYLEYYPGGKKNHKLQKRVKEGLATFIQKYVEQPTIIGKEYPYLVNEILKNTGRYYYPIFNDLIKESRDIVEKYQKLSPLKKIGARILINEHPIQGSSFLNWKENVIQEYFDFIYPLEKMAKESGVGWTKDDPSLWAHFYGNNSNIIIGNITGKNGYWTLKNGEFKKLYDFNWGTLLDVLHKQGNLEDFPNFLVARREYFLYEKLDKLKEEAVKAQENLKNSSYLLHTPRKEIEVERRKVKDYIYINDVLKKDNFDRETVTQAYLEEKDRFVKVSEMFDNLTRADLDLLNSLDVGLVSPEQYNEYIQDKGYASLKRDVRYNEIIGEKERLFTVKTGKVKISSLMRRKGSEKTIINPVYSSILNHSEILRKAIKQIIINKVYKISLSFPDVMQKLKLETNIDKFGQISFPQERDENILMARDNYKRVPLLINDKLLKSVIDKIWTIEDISQLEKGMIEASRLFTKGTTALYPVFAVFNILRDNLTAVSNTSNNFIPLFSPLKAILQMLNNTEGETASNFKEYLMLGGEKQTFARMMDLPPNEMIDKIIKEKKGIEILKEYIDKGLNIVSFPSKWSEIITRGTEYDLSRKSGKSQLAALEEAGRVTGPFHHQGRYGRKSFGTSYIKSIPFFKANLEVLAQTARTWNNSKIRNRAVFVAALLITGMVSAIMYSYKRASEEQKRRLKNLSPSLLAQYIWLPSPDGKGLLSFPVIEHVGAVGGLINMMIMDNLMNTKYSFGEYLDTAASWIPDQLNVTDPVRQVFSSLLQAVSPIIGVLTEKRFYPKTMPLESAGLKNLPPSERFYAETPKIAKMIGKIIPEKLNLSPIKIDYLIEGYFGRAARPLLGKMYSNPVTKELYFNSMRNIQYFYETRDTIYQKYNLARQKDTEFKEYEIYHKLKNIDKLIESYRKIEKIDKEDVNLQDLRTNILDEIDSLRDAVLNQKNMR